MNVKNLLMGFAVSVGLLSCSAINPIEVKTVQEDKTVLGLANPKPISAKDVSWIVITPENAAKIFNDMESNGYDLVLFGLTDDSYENLSLNLNNIRSFIKQQRDIITSYKTYYEPNRK